MASRSITNLLWYHLLTVFHLLIPCSYYDISVTINICLYFEGFQSKFAWTLAPGLKDQPGSKNTTD